MAAPALADARDADGLTPLHLAVVHGNVPLVQTLLAAGADVNARDDEHHTVVHWATGEYCVTKATGGIGELPRPLKLCVIQSKKGGKYIGTHLNGVPTGRVLKL